MTKEILQDYVEEEKRILQPNPYNTKTMIYVPEVNLRFTSSRILCGLNFYETKDRLRAQNMAMPTPYQFRAYLKFLWDSNESRHKEIFNDITDKRGPYRGEWLNARFEKKAGSIWMISEDALIYGKICTIEQILDNYLMYDVEISLDAWIDSTTEHGLPPPEIKKEHLGFGYFEPMVNFVARFNAYSGRAILNYVRFPTSSNAGLGVFGCAVPESLESADAPSLEDK
jgi:hypothetical protein